MKWQKLGLVYSSQGTSKWALNSALTPTPVLMKNGVIRVYAGFRDIQGVSRIGYVDLDQEQPSKIIRVSEYPVLDIGEPGSFDDNGMILGDILEVNGNLHMYYVGFQIVQKVKFLAFTGLAVSTDQGESFQRVSRAPVIDRSDSELSIRAAHTVIYDEGKFKAWIGGGSGWEIIDGTPFPIYNVRYLESSDGINFSQKSKVCIDFVDDEYRIGRPRVYKTSHGYQMYYTKGNKRRHYLPGYAESKDGVIWERKDSQVGIHLSESGWDSRHLCYPSLLTVGSKTYMFYNGNDMGKDGFGCAELRV